MPFVNVQQSRFQLNQSSVLELLKDEAKAEKNADTQRTQLYSHQIQALLETVNYFPDGYNPDLPGLLQIPTGGGKSGIISLLPYAIGAKKVMVLSPGIQITRQLEKSFGGSDSTTSFVYRMIPEARDGINNFLPPVHTITSAKHQIPDMSKYELIIVNAQKFTRNNNPEIILHGSHKYIPANVFNDFDTIIVDEAHHYPATTWTDIVEIFKNKKIIFLTATPNPDAQGLYNQIYRITRSELEERKIIRRINFRPLDFGNINSATDDELKQVTQGINETFTSQDSVVTNIVHKAMVLVTNNQSVAKSIAERLDNLNLNATYCISDDESDANLRNFDENNGTYRVMVVCKKLTEGYDNSNVSVCVILRNIQSDILFEQFVGRSIRVSHDRENLQNDDVEAVVYGPRGIWERYERNATTDPVEEDGE